MTTESSPVLRPGVEDFESFYASRYDEIVRALAVTLQDQGLARDAAQEAFTRCFERWAQVSRHRNLSGWVYRVGLNWARSWIRRRRKERHRGDITPATARDIPLPSDRNVVLALQRLPLDQRAVVVLRFFLDWSVEQTADALGVPGGTVKSRQHRALNHLERWLEVEP